MHIYIYSNCMWIRITAQDIFHYVLLNYSTTKVSTTSSLHMLQSVFVYKKYLNPMLLNLVLSAFFSGHQVQSSTEISEGRLFDGGCPKRRELYHVDCKWPFWWHQTCFWTGFLGSIFHRWLCHRHNWWLLLDHCGYRSCKQHRN